MLPPAGAGLPTRVRSVALQSSDAGDVKEHPLTVGAGRHLERLGERRSSRCDAGQADRPGRLALAALGRTAVLNLLAVRIVGLERQRAAAGHLDLRLVIDVEGQVLGRRAGVRILAG